MAKMWVKESLSDKAQNCEGCGQQIPAGQPLVAHIDKYYHKSCLNRTRLEKLETRADGSHRPLKRKPKTEDAMNHRYPGNYENGRRR